MSSDLRFIISLAVHVLHVSWILIVHCNIVYCGFNLNNKSELKSAVDGTDTQNN